MKSLEILNLFYKKTTHPPNFSWLLLCLFLSCSSQNSYHIVVPSLNTNISLNEGFTYSESLITNMTSAHLVAIDKDLSIKKEVLDKVENLGSNQYLITLVKDYRNFRGEKITTEDILFTIKYYLKNLPAVAQVLNMIKGSQECKSNEHCILEGFKSISSNQFQLTFTSYNENFINDLASPSFIILKANKPIFEKIGDCKIPYQTGRSFVTACSKNNIQIKQGKNLYSLKTQSNSKDDFFLTTENHNKKTSPSLTSMFFLKNPNASHDHNNLIKLLNHHSQEIASLINLEHSSTYTSKWLGVTRGKKNDPFKKMKCPSKTSLVIDASIPFPHKIMEKIRIISQCSIKYKIVKAQNYFTTFKQSDIGLLWFTPGFLDLYDLLSVFDCNPYRLCLFDFNDQVLNKKLQRLSKRENRYTNKKLATEIETLIQDKGYIAPIAELNWWFKNSKEMIIANPAGLYQVRLGEISEN